MPARRVIFHGGARQDIEEAFAWYFERSERTAADFVLALERAVALIQEAPTSWPTRGSQCRAYLLARFPFSIIYRFDETQLEIVAVEHASRRPGYWRARLESS